MRQVFPQSLSPALRFVRLPAERSDAGDRAAPGAPRHFFYVKLERHIPGCSITCAAKKVFFDQAVLSVFIDTTFLVGMALLEGRGLAASLQNLKDRFPRVYMYDNLLWPPVQMVNFCLVPAKFRVLYVTAFNMVWNTILSFSHHQGAKPGS